MSAIRRHIIIFWKLFTSYVKNIFVVPTVYLAGNHSLKLSRNARKSMATTNFMIDAEMEMSSNIVLMVRRQIAPDVALF